MSPSTCTSTCRPLSTYGSQKTVGSPNADAASAEADSTAAATSATARTTRMPRPPPPADALTSSGRSSSVTSLGDSSASTGTPAAAISFLAATLEAICSIASGVGPTQVSPAVDHRRAKSALSDRKP